MGAISLYLEYVLNHVIPHSSLFTLGFQLYQSLCVCALCIILPLTLTTVTVLSVLRILSNLQDR